MDPPLSTINNQSSKLYYNEKLPPLKQAKNHSDPSGAAALAAAAEAEAAAAAEAAATAAATAEAAEAAAEAAAAAAGDGFFCLVLLEGADEGAIMSEGTDEDSSH